MGFDAFGIHSENYALTVGTNPAKLIPQNIATFRRQLRRFGGMYDWRHELSTTDPAYYKWTQWLFLQLFKAGLAYKKRAAVNWCPKDKTVLANEQVIDGRCERCDTPVEQRFLDQWFFRITNYAERLLENLQNLDWSSSTALLQKNWIGRSEGAELIFETPSGKKITVFTTRPDTVFGATYLVLAPEHPLVDELTAVEQRSAVKAYQRDVQSKDIVSRRVGEKTKTGVFIGSYARNPATGEAIPIWIADYVLMEYGTGAIMAVPPHHPRDHEFATAFKLPIREGGRRDEPLPSVTEDGMLVNSGRVNRLPFRHAQRGIVAGLQFKCPTCGAQGRRETDVSDTFLDSAWYFLRYPSTEFDDRPWDEQRTRTWLPVTTYIGGNEHAVLHLLYSRFVTMALQELGHLHFEEPFPKLRAHGLIIKDGAKMSKSRGNVVIPDAYIQKWGADTIRMYLMFLGPFQEGGDFRDTGIVGIRRFLEKIWSPVHDVAAPDQQPLPAEVQIF